MNRVWRTERGFTLVEILFALVLMSFIGITVAAVFQKSMAVWKRSVSEDSLERRGEFSVEFLASELRNSINFSAIEFEGGSDKLAFPVFLPVEKENAVWRVEYKYDAENFVLVRNVRNMSDIYKKLSGVDENIVNSVKSFNLEYAYNAEENSVEWKDSWQMKKERPSGVRIRMVLFNDFTEREFIKTAYLPIGCVGRE